MLKIANILKDKKVIGFQDNQGKAKDTTRDKEKDKD